MSESKTKTATRGPGNNEATAPDEIKATTSSNPFELSKLKLSQKFGAELGVKKLITTVPVRKPHKQAFVRVRADEAYQMTAYLLELGDGSIGSEMYIVDPNLGDELAGEVQPALLVTAIDRQGNLFLWPIKLPKDGKTNTWNESALLAAKEAESSWVRVTANQAQGVYDVYVAAKSFGDPVWPELSLQQLIEKAFKDKLIDSIDHPAIKRLRGEE